MWTKTRKGMRASVLSVEPVHSRALMRICFDTGVRS